jgi:hypothetical protein
MGCGYEAACKDCKVRTTQLGYGGYSTWLTHTSTLAEYDAASAEKRALIKNQNWRRFLEKHEGHAFFNWSEDYSTMTDGVLFWDDFGDGQAPPPVDMRDYEIWDMGWDK